VDTPQGNPNFASLHETVAKIRAFAARKKHFHAPFPRAHHALHVRHDDLSKPDQASIDRRTKFLRFALEFASASMHLLTSAYAFHANARLGGDRSQRIGHAVLLPYHPGIR
jgi:hypothetical protein